MCPEADASAEIDNLLGVVVNGRDDELVLEQIVTVEVMLYALTHLLRLVVGEAVAVITKQGLVTPVVSMH